MVWSNSLQFSELGIRSVGIQRENFTKRQNCFQGGLFNNRTLKIVGYWRCHQKALKTQRLGNGRTFLVAQETLPHLFANTELMISYLFWVHYLFFFVAVFCRKSANVRNTDNYLLCQTLIGTLLCRRMNRAKDYLTGGGGCCNRKSSFIKRYSTKYLDHWEISSCAYRVAN